MKKLLISLAIVTSIYLVGGIFIGVGFLVTHFFGAIGVFLYLFFIVMTGVVWAALEEAL